MGIDLILISILLLGMILLIMWQGKKQKKAQADFESMLDTLRVGMRVKMVSGMLGRIKEIREEAPGFKTILLETGDPKNPTVLNYVMEAIQGIVNEEAINQLNLKKAEEALQESTKTTLINGEPVDASQIDAASYVEKRNEQSKKKTNKKK